MSTHEWLELLSLIAWIVTAGGGFVLLAIYLGRGGMRQREPGRIRPAQVLSHFLLAATGLVLWIVYYAIDEDVLAWISFVILVVVALIGFSMFALWLRQRAAPQPIEGRPVEQNFPVAIVYLHGLLAASTLTLVLLTALEIGE